MSAQGLVRMRCIHPVLLVAFFIGKKSLGILGQNSIVHPKKRTNFYQRKSTTFHTHRLDRMKSVAVFHRSIAWAVSSHLPPVMLRCPPYPQFPSSVIKFSTSSVCLEASPAVLSSGLLCLGHSDGTFWELRTRQQSTKGGGRLQSLDNICPIG